MPVKTLSGAEDIKLLVHSFYDKLMVDEVIGHFFTSVVPLDLTEHLPIICRFWEAMLLDNPVYQGNPMTKHLVMDEISSLEPEHFQRWLTLWEETLDAHFIGPNVDKAKERARNIALLM
nr:group III truncated hemoglobin [Saprospiraceae bacterium]